MEKIAFKFFTWKIQNFKIKPALDIESDQHELKLGIKKFKFGMRLTTDEKFLKFGLNVSRHIKDTMFRAVFDIRSGDENKRTIKIINNKLESNIDGIDLEDVADVVNNEVLEVVVDFIAFPLVPNEIVPAADHRIDFSILEERKNEMSLMAIRLIFKFHDTGTIGEVLDLNVLSEMLNIQREFKNADLLEQLKINLNRCLCLGKYTATQVYSVADQFQLEEIKTSATAFTFSHFMRVTAELPIVLRDVVQYFYLHPREKFVTTIAELKSNSAEGTLKMKKKA